MPERITEPRSNLFVSLDTFRTRRRYDGRVHFDYPRSRHLALLNKAHESLFPILQRIAEQLHGFKVGFSQWSLFSAAISLHTMNFDPKKIGDAPNRRIAEYSFLYFLVTLPDPDPDPDRNDLAFYWIPPRFVDRYEDHYTIGAAPATPISSWVNYIKNVPLLNAALLLAQNFHECEGGVFRSSLSRYDDLRVGFSQSDFRYALLNQEQWQETPNEAS